MWLRRRGSAHSWFRGCPAEGPRAFRQRGPSDHVPVPVKTARRQHVVVDCRHSPCYSLQPPEDLECEGDLSEDEDVSPGSVADPDLDRGIYYSKQ